MPNAEKVAKVTALKERIRGADALLLAEYRGLSVHDATELRRSLSDQARFSIVKNTLMQRAAADAGVGELQALLEGPTAVAFVQGDVVTTAKRVVDAAKRFPALVLKGGYLEGRVLSAAEAQALATLESREVTLSRVAGMLKAELNRAASAFQALQTRFLGVLDAYEEKLSGRAGVAEAQPVGEIDSMDTISDEVPANSEGAGEESAVASESVPEAQTERGPRGQGEDGPGNGPGNGPENRKE